MQFAFAGCFFCSSSLRKAYKAVRKMMKNCRNAVELVNSAADEAFIFGVLPTHH